MVEPVRRFAWLRIGRVPRRADLQRPLADHGELVNGRGELVGMAEKIVPVTGCPVCTAFDPSGSRGLGLGVPTRLVARLALADRVDQVVPFELVRFFSQAAGRPTSGPTQPCSCPCKSATSPECQWWRASVLLSENGTSLAANCDQDHRTCEHRYLALLALILGVSI